MNKSAYKLKGFGPLYVINLDDQPERMEWMANQLEEWEIKDYTRISAYDGRPSTGNDLSDIIKGKVSREYVAWRNRMCYITP